MGNNMTKENNTPINYEASTSKYTLDAPVSIQRERSNSCSNALSVSRRGSFATTASVVANLGSRRGSRVNLPTLSVQDTIGSTESLAEQNINFTQQSIDYISKHDLEELYDYINEITKENHWMHIDEIIQNLQKSQKHISTTLIDRFSSQKWDTRSDDGHSFFTIAIERDDQDNILYLRGYMKEEQILRDSAKQGSLNHTRQVKKQGLEDSMNLRWIL
jgi:hypothetical protein